MTIEVVSYSYSVGEFNFHIQLTPAFRRPVFPDDKVRKLVKAYLLGKANQLKVKIVAVDFGPDHLHFFC